MTRRGTIPPRWTFADRGQQRRTAARRCVRGGGGAEVISMIVVRPSVRWTNERVAERDQVEDDRRARSQRRGRSRLIPRRAGSAATPVMPWRIASGIDPLLADRLGHARREVRMLRLLARPSRR